MSNGKGVLIGLGILLAGALLARGKSNEVAAFIALATVILLIIAIDRTIKGNTMEAIITGVLIGLIETYHFFIAGEMAFGVSFPELGGSLAFFFGAAAIFRGLILLLENVDNPLKKPLRRWLRSG